MNIKINLITIQFLLLTLFCLGQEDEALAAKTPKKPWTIMVYMAATNDLAIFAPRNILQMQKVSSNNYVNIIAQHNFYEKNKTASKTFFIDKGTKIVISESYNQTDCGEAETLIAFCAETISKYPADHYALIIWNHGTGVLEPIFRSNLSASELFSLSDSKDFFKTYSKVIGFLPFYEINASKEICKGVCFNDETNKFMNEQQLCHALKTICATSLNHKKLDIIAFDACLMAMIEIALAMEPYADIMVASEDVERGTGWNYQYALCPFLVKAPSPKELGAHFVCAYEKTYKNTKGFTQSCILLNELEGLSNNISRVASLLQQMLMQQNNKDIKKNIRLSRNKHLCTHFDEPEFIDLLHFYKNLLSQISLCPDAEKSVASDNVAELKNELLKGQELLVAAIHKNSAGVDFAGAHGLSIYFPEDAIHSSYKKTAFAFKTNWLSFLKTYLSLSSK